MKRIYLSGGFVTDWQDELIELVGVDSAVWYNPSDNYMPSTTRVMVGVDIYGPMDKYMISNCDIVFGYLEASNPTPINIIAELMYAKGLGKIIILCNEWTEDRYKAKELKTQVTADEDNNATWFKPRYLEMVLSWCDFVETDFGRACEILKALVTLDEQTE